MKVHYKKGFAIAFICMGSMLLVLNLMLMGVKSGDPTRIMQLAISVLLLINGILYLTKPAFELRENELVIFNLLGKEMRRYGFASKSDIKHENGKIMINSGGNWQRVRIGKGLLRSEEWEAVVQSIS